LLLSYLKLLSCLILSSKIVQSRAKSECKICINVTKFLQSDEFSKLAKNGFLTFDAGVTLKHGPYSHRLQLNILDHAYKERSKTDPVKLYKEMTDQRFINTKQSEYTVWVDIFDGVQLPRAFSVAGLPENPSAWQQTHLQAYSNPFFVTEHPIETLPQLDFVHFGGKNQA
jgi:hypothetical protein